MKTTTTMMRQKMLQLWACLKIAELASNLKKTTILQQTLTLLMMTLTHQ
jgi:hypothetical protein